MWHQISSTHIFQKRDRNWGNLCNFMSVLFSTCFAHFSPLSSYHILLVVHHSSERKNIFTFNHFCVVPSLASHHKWMDGWKSWWGKIRRWRWKSALCTTAYHSTIICLHSLLTFSEELFLPLYYPTSQTLTWWWWVYELWMCFLCTIFSTFYHDTILCLYVNR